MNDIFTAKMLEDSFPDEITRRRVKFEIIAKRERGYVMGDLVETLKAEFSMHGAILHHRTAIAWIVSLIRHEDRYRVRAVP